MRRILGGGLFAVLAACSSGHHVLARPVPTTASTAVPRTVSTPPAPSPERASRSRSARMPSEGASHPAPGPAGDLLDRVADCESHRNTRAVGGHGRYFGAFQQSVGSWSRFGNGQPILEQSYEVQKAAAARQLAAEGLRPWPVCGPRAAGGGGGKSW